MQKKLKFIHIGTGGFGGQWCKNFLPYIVKELGNAEIVAAVDINPDMHQNIIQSLDMDPAQCYTDLRKALQENPCDFVSIAVPAAVHEYAVDLALEFNCHIIMEKPISDTMESSCRLYQKVKSSGKKMAVTVSHTYDQDKQTLKSLINSGSYGDLHYIIGRFTSNNRASVPNLKEYAHHNFLISSVIHHFDIIRSLSGANAKTVYTQSWNPHWAQFKEHSTALISMEMQNGVRALFEGSKSNATELNSWGNDYFRVECEKATLELNCREITLRSDLDSTVPKFEQIPLIGEISPWRHQWLLKQFIDWIHGGEAPGNNIDDNLQSTALQYAAIESGFTNQVVDVQQFLDKHLHRNVTI